MSPTAYETLRWNPSAAPETAAAGSPPRQMGALMIAAALAALAWVLMPHDADVGRSAMLALILAGGLLGATLLAGRLDGCRDRTFALAITGANVLVSAAVAVLGARDPGFAFVYLWITPYAYVFLSARQAALQTAIVAAGLAVALSLRAGSAPLADATYWFCATASVVVVGTLARRLTRAARTSDRRFRSAFEQTATASALIACDGTFVDANDAMARLLGLPAGELSGVRFPDVVEAGRRERVRGALRGGGAAPFEATLRSFAGADVLGAVSIAAIDEAEACFYLQIVDVTEVRRAEEERAAVARDNALILDCAGDGIVRMDTEGRVVYANPAAARLLGHAVDELVGADAHALMHHTRVDGTAYPESASPIRAAAESGQVSRVTDEVFWRKDGSSFAVDYTSAPIRDQGRITGAVCVFADISGRVAHELEARQQDRWRARIEQARRTDQFLVYSQPILDLAGGEIAHEELLIRMRGATPDEVIPPGQFLPEAERHGLMASIDQWMIDQALRMAARGRRVAVNISAQSLGRADLVKEIENGLRDSGADPADLTFEITETAAVHQIDAAHDFAVALNELGCRIALDDFGTGFGSFSYLKSFPAQFLKIDIEFVRDLVHSESDQRIVQTIVRMARDFGQQTIAEGVEDSPTLELLRAYGVDYAQGYFIGRPLPAERGII